MKKILQDNLTVIVCFIFWIGVYYHTSQEQTRQILLRLNAQWPVTAQQLWSDRLSFQNNQMSIPSVKDALFDSNLRLGTDN